MAEKFSNNAQTTLNGAITDVAISLIVTTATAFPSGGNFRIIIDSEIMLVTSITTVTTFNVTRAQEGTSAVAHGDLSIVTHVLTAGSLGVAYARIDQANLVGTINGSSQLVQLDSGSSVAKGSLLIGSGSATVAPLAVGADGQFVVADSSQTDGVKYTDLTWNIKTPSVSASLPANASCEFAPGVGLKLASAVNLTLHATSSLIMRGTGFLGYKLVKQLYYTVASTFPYSPSSPNIRKMRVQCWGAGGGASGVPASGAAAVSIGVPGGGGGYAVTFFTVTTPYYTVTVGAGGPGGTGNASGTVGGDTTVATAAGVILCSATGGAFGSSAQILTTGTSFAFTGPGGTGGVVVGGADFGSTGTPGMYGIRMSGTAGWTGIGGQGAWGGGIGGSFNLGAGTGQNGATGGGGGGACMDTNAGGARTGGTGGNGVVIIEEYE